MIHKPKIDTAEVLVLVLSNNDNAQKFEHFPYTVHVVEEMILNDPISVYFFFKWDCPKSFLQHHEQCLENVQIPNHCHWYQGQIAKHQQYQSWRLIWNR